jgi:hypothetical protein
MTTLAKLLDQTERFITSYVRMGAEEAVAATLFVAYSHVVDAFRVAPYLNITSPEPECGKTILLEALELLVREPWLVSQPTEAVLFRTLDKKKPTLLLDETDAVFKGSSDRAEPIRAVLNSGYRRGVTVPRCAGKTFDLVEFTVYGPKCFAGIGDALPDTVAKRSIRIELRRLAPGEEVKDWDHEDAEPEAKPIKEAFEGWAKGAVKYLKGQKPGVPEGIRNRQRETWRPLLSIADLAGDGWPGGARDAAKRLCNVHAKVSLPALLLSHVRESFAEKDAMSTHDLLSALVDRDDGPWASWWANDVEAGRIKGPAAKLGRLLRDHRTPAGEPIRSHQYRTEGRIVRGYVRDDFEDAWSRYLKST